VAWLNLEVGDVTLWYKSHSFNNDPTWAICHQTKYEFQKLNLRGCLQHVCPNYSRGIGKIHEEFERIEPRG
jgi:hypothetical protein